MRPGATQPKSVSSGVRCVASDWRDAVVRLKRAEAGPTESSTSVLPKDIVVPEICSPYPPHGRRRAIAQQAVRLNDDPDILMTVASRRAEREERERFELSDLVSQVNSLDRILE